MAGLGTCLAPGATSGFTFPVGGGRGRGPGAEKDVLGLQGPADSGALLGDQLSPETQNGTSHARRELATEENPYPIS